MDVLIPMADLIDKDAEKARLGKDLQKLEQEVTRLNGKLNNKKFVDKAPADVVEKEKLKLSHAVATIEQIKEQLERIDRM